ncbi:MAG: hypothetical protein WC453_03290 [Patescibacteria group bacterium]
MTKIVNGQAVALNSPARSQRINLKYCNLGLGALIAIAGFLYLLNINDLTVLGFTLRDLKTQAAALSSANLEYQEAVNTAQSYYSLSARTKNLNMVAVGDVEYLTMAAPVAMAR